MIPAAFPESRGDADYSPALQGLRAKYRRGLRASEQAKSGGTAGNETLCPDMNLRIGTEGFLFTVKARQAGLGIQMGSHERAARSGLEAFTVCDVPASGRGL